MNKEIGEKLKKRRIELKLSKRQVADRSGLTYHTVLLAENGVHYITLKTLSKLCDALNLKIDVN